MPERKEVMSWLEGLTDEDWRRYHSDSEVRNIAKAALELLKEQEPASPTWEQGKAYCGNCGQKLPRKKAGRKINYCSYCGRPLKWQ